jgi:predicted TIM-barrel fold metal-dependent hydrolase
MADGRAPIVDAHAHVFTRAMPFAADAHSRPDYDYPVETWLADMERHGITHGVIAAASLFDDGNAYTLAVLAKHRQLRGTVIVPPDVAAAELRAMADQGVCGVRLTWRRQASFPDLSQGPYPAFLRALADCGMHIELLAGSTGLTVLLPQFAASGVRLVVDHFGVPSRDPAEREAGMAALLRAVEGGDTWVKISAGFRLPPELADEATARLLADAGPERLLWGSDAPFVNHEGSIDYPGALALYERLVPDAGTRAAIDATAMQLYFS